MMMEGARREGGIQKLGQLGVFQYFLGRSTPFGFQQRLFTS